MPIKVTVDSSFRYTLTDTMLNNPTQERAVFFPSQNHQSSWRLNSLEQILGRYTCLHKSE